MTTIGAVMSLKHGIIGWFCNGYFSPRSDGGVQHTQRVQLPDSTKKYDVPQTVNGTAMDNVQCATIGTGNRVSVLTLGGPTPSLQWAESRVLRFDACFVPTGGNHTRRHRCSGIREDSMVRRTHGPVDRRRSGSLVHA